MTSWAEAAVATDASATSAASRENFSFMKVSGCES
jgi:hypothetical protein